MTGGTESQRYSESSFRDAESNTIHLDVTESPLAAPHRRGALMTRIWSLADMPPSLSVYGPRKSEPSARVFYRKANSEERG